MSFHSGIDSKGAGVARAPQEFGSSKKRTESYIQLCNSSLGFDFFSKLCTRAAIFGPIDLFHKRVDFGAYLENINFAT